MNTLNAKVVARLNSLSEEGKRMLFADFDPSINDFVAWKLSCKSILEYASLNLFLEQFLHFENRYSESNTNALPELQGVITSASDQVSLGFASHIKFLIHAEFFSTIEEQAKELLESGHLIPAAVLARIVIEKWLHDLAEKNGITIGTKDSASTINDKLRIAQVYAMPKSRLIQSHLDVGNAAAHGDTNAFSPSDVKSMLEFIETTCAE